MKHYPGQCDHDCHTSSEPMHQTVLMIAKIVMDYKGPAMVFISPWQEEIMGLAGMMICC